jgi:hypothetical protein
MRQTRRNLGAMLGTIPAAAMLGPAGAIAQGTAEDTLPPTLDEPGKILLTVFLRHDETKTVDQINEHLRQTGWYDKFPPPGVDVVAWFVMMGIGQVVIVRLPPDRPRDTNRVVEAAAWGGFRTQFYPTYDYRRLWVEAKHQADAKR